jgi:hypothetical protein
MMLFDVLFTFFDNILAGLTLAGELLGLDLQVGLFIPLAGMLGFLFELVSGLLIPENLLSVLLLLLGAWLIQRSQILGRRLLRWQTDRHLTFPQRKFKQWLTIYMAVAHNCDHRILDQLWISDEGTHGRSVLECYEDVIRDTVVFLRERGFRVRYTGTGWKISHLRWEAVHPDGREVTIDAADKVAALLNTELPNWGNFNFFHPTRECGDVSRTWGCGKDTEVASLVFRQCIFDCLWKFVDM